MRGKKPARAISSKPGLECRAWSGMQSCLAGANPCQIGSIARAGTGRAFDLAPAGRAKLRLLWGLQRPICRGHWLQGFAGCNVAGHGWALNPVIRVILTGERQYLFMPVPAESPAVSGQFLASFRPVFGRFSDCRARKLKLDRLDRAGVPRRPQIAGLGGLSRFDSLAI
jgi:hypothetical protein